MAGQNVEGSENLAFGTAAGRNVTGSDNVGIGQNAGEGVDGINNLAIGHETGRSVTGSQNVGLGISAGAGVTGFNNVGVGALAGGSSEGDYNVGVGERAGRIVTGDSNAALGHFAGNRVTGSDNVAIGHYAGTQVHVDPALRVEADRTVSIGNRAVAMADDAIAIGSGAQANGLQAISIGTGNQVDGDNSGAIGDPTTITGSGSYSLGNDNTIAADNAGTFGNDNVLGADADGSRIIGNGNDVDVADAFVIGNGADVTVAEGVALGNGSIADTGAGVAGYNPATGAADGLDAGIAATQSTTGALAVGDAGGGVFRQITGVAAGTEDSDAVNVAQLKGVEDLATTPLTFAGDSGSNVDRQLGETLNVTGGAAGTLTSGNIGVVGDGTDTLELQLAEDLDLGANGSVTAGDSLLDTNGLTVDDGAGNVATTTATGSTVTDGTTITAMTAGGLTSGNINLDGTSDEITGLSNTTLTDPSFAMEGRAATEEQLDLVNQTANTGWNLTAEGADGTNVAPGDTVDLSNSDGNLVIAKNATDGAEEDVIFDLADDITVDSVTAGDSLLDTNGLTVDDGAGNVASTTATGTTVTDGTTTTAMTAGGVTSGNINLDGTSDEITGLSNTTLTDPGFATEGRAATEEQLDLVNQTANTGWNLTAEGADGTNVAPGNTVDLSNTDGNLVIAKNATDGAEEDVTFDLADDVTIGNSLTINNGPTLNDNGIDMGGDRITNVGGPTNGGDAVNLDYFNENKAHYYSVNDGGVIGGNYDNDGATGVNAMAGGVGSLASADGAMALGFGADARVLDSVALGSGSVSSRAVAPASGSIPAGSANITYNTTDKTLLGAVSVGYDDAYRQITNVADGTQEHDAVTVRQLQGAIGSVIDTGIMYFHANSAQPDSIAAGPESIAVGPATVVNGDAGIGMGNGAIVEMTAPGGTAIGDGAHVMLADGMALGTSSLAEAEQGVALGAGATVSHDQSVALGSNSVTAEPVATAGTTIASSNYDFAGTAPQSTVSVGDVGNERTITNVAAGRLSASSTDAINGSQLFATNQAVENASQGWNLTAEGADGTNVAPGDTVDLSNTDGNLVIAKNAADGAEESVTFALSDDVTIGNSLTINNGPTLNDNGIDMGGDTITNVGAPVNEGDAVNKQYVDGAGDALVAEGMNFSGNDGDTIHRDLGQTLAVTGEASADGTFSGTNLKTVTDPATGAIQLQMTDAPQFGNVTINDGDTGRITGVTAGTEDNDAVNVSQLNDVSDVANTGWNLTAEGADGTNVAPGDTVDLSNSDGNLVIAKNATDGAEESVTFALSDDVTIDNSLTINNGPTLNDNGIDMGGDTITNVGAPVNEGDAVNKQYVDGAGDALIAEGMNFSGNDGDTIHRDLGQTLAVTGEASADGTFSGTNLKTVTDPATGAIQLQMADAPQFGDVTINDGGSGKISGVADGDINEDSTDVVNGSQLWETQQALEGEQVHYYSVNDGGTQGGNYANDGATGVNAIAAGVDATATADGAIAIGAGATASEAGSVALGAASTTDAVVGTAGTTIGGQTYTFAGAAPLGTLSVGSVGAERTITHVAAGRISADSTDAVNGSQLYATNQAVESIDNRVGDVEGDVSVLGDRVTNVEGDVSSISNDLGELADQAVKYDTNDDGSVNYESVTLAGGEGTTITNLADGEVSEGSSDVVNGSQLWAVQNQINNSLATGETKYFKANSEAAAARVEGAESVAMGPESVAAGDNSVAVGNGARAESDGGVALGAGSQATREGMNGAEEAFSNESVASTQGAVSVGSQGGERQITHVAGGTEATDAVNVRQLESVQAGSVNYDRHSDGSVDYSSVTFGQKGTPTQIHNVAPGTAPTDAANVGQLQELNQQFNHQIGGLSNRIDEVERNANAGIAGVAAMGDAPYVPGKLTYHVGGGYHGGESAVGLNFRRTADNGRWSLTAGAAGSRAGATIGIGVSGVID
ncbi:hypothetical protein AR456_09380 [Halomonas huangheensis]|nr:hypothetical protein AR456_09380 [Halomonas huangheensis]